MLRKHLTIIFIICCVILSSCTNVRIRPQKIKIAVIPSIDALPLYISVDENFFYGNGVTVEIIPVATPEERDNLILTGQVDAIITDLVSTICINKESLEVLVVRTAHQSHEGAPRFKLVSAPDTNKRTVIDLKNDTIGVGRNSDAEYLLDRVIEKAGLPYAEVDKSDIQPAADLFKFLMEGKITAAFLPEPYASLAEKEGAHSILEDTYFDTHAAAVIAFDSEFAKTNRDAVKGFLRGYERAVEEFNADKNKFADLVAEMDLVPASIRGAYEIHAFPEASIPEETQFATALVWLLDRGILDQTFYYENFFDSSFLPPKE